MYLESRSGARTKSRDHLGLAFRNAGLFDDALRRSASMFIGYKQHDVGGWDRASERAQSEFAEQTLLSTV